jgi:putative ABC transport system permease protein
LIQDKQAWSQWGLVQVTTWLELPSRQAAVGLQRALPAFIDRHGRTLGSVPHKVLRFDLAPLPSLHLIEHKDRLVVATLGLVGLVTLLIAAVNYVNLATARAGLRAREVAMRKVLGATRGVLVGQFLGEAVLTAAAAGVIGLAVAELVLPLVNAAGGLALEIDYVQGGRVLLAVGVVVLVVGVGAGLYPALSLSGFRPAAVLASARAPGGGRAGARMRELLVVAQFAIVIALAIATAVLFAQTRFLRTADLGFQRRGLIVVDSFADPALTRAQQSALLNLWRALPGVSGATVSDTAPGTEGVSGGANFRRPGETGTGPILRIVTTGPDFFRVYAARFLAGRALDQDHRLDGPVPPEQPGVAASRNVVLNLAAAKTLGFSKPSEAIGQTVFGEIPVGDKPQRSELEIVGVVQDFRFHSPREAVPPALYVFQPDAPDGAIAAVRFQAAEPQAVIAQMRTIWRQVAPNVPFEAKTAEANLSTYYRQDDQQTRLFTIGSVVAVAIGCLGLYGLSSFNTARRTKEIGIRKTLGASTADVLMLLLNQFLRPVLLANLIAWPVAYFAIRLWLSGFDQRITLSPLYFLVATLGALAIATFTVMGQTLKVAQSEPAKALRYE